MIENCDYRIGVIILVLAVLSMVGLNFLTSSTSILAQTPGNSNYILVEDIFGRKLNDFGIVLVDWEGYLANPAIEIFITPPSDFQFPAQVVLTANDPRLYFDSPDKPRFSNVSFIGPSGPTRIVDYNNSTPQSVFISIFPDRDTTDEDHLISIEFTDAANRKEFLTLKLHVIGQDQKRELFYDIIVDFSQDETGFFSDSIFGQQRRSIVEQAARDWAYFIDDMQLDTVAAFDESTFIFDPDTLFTTGKLVQNINTYDGFLLYVYGIDAPQPPFRSGGEPSTHSFQTTSNGVATLPLRRSGGTELEIKGNFNNLGWILTERDDDWWVSANLDIESNDLYSIAHHEMGHAIFANSGYLGFASSE